MHKQIKFIFLTIFLLALSSLAFADQSNCEFGEVYVDGVGCQVPKLQVEQKVFDQSGVQIASSVSGGLEPIRIDNPFVAPGQPVLVELTISNIGSQYPFNLIPLPPNQYAFVLTIDPVDEILYKKEDGTYGRYNINNAKWGSWFGSDWFAKSSYFLRKSVRDFNAVTSDDLCKYVEAGDLFPDFAKKRFIYDNYEKIIEERHGKINDENFNDKITQADINEFFPAVYEWECIRSVDRESFEKEIKDDYCDTTITMGCMGDYMRDNVGKLKTSSFVLLSDDVPEGKCDYNQKDGITYCGVGDDGICPPGTQSVCSGESSYTYEFILLTPADAPALSPQEFDTLVNSGQIGGDFKTSSATGESYNFGFTQSAICPENDLSGGCHTMNVRVQAVNQNGIKNLFQEAIKTGGLVGAGSAVVSAGNPLAVFAGSLLGSQIGLVKGIMTWGNFELIGSPIYEGQGIFYVVAPALKVTALFTLYLAVLAGTSGFLLLTRRRS